VEPEDASPITPDVEVEIGMVTLRGATPGRFVPVLAAGEVEVLVAAVVVVAVAVADAAVAVGVALVGAPVDEEDNGGLVEIGRLGTASEIEGEGTTGTSWRETSTVSGNGEFTLEIAGKIPTRRAE